ncbi:MAG: Rne/Rng family ribonuclease, partial [Acidimicrobiia bacterium]
MSDAPLGSTDDSAGTHGSNDAFDNDEATSDELSSSGEAGQAGQAGQTGENGENGARKRRRRGSRGGRNRKKRQPSAGGEVSESPEDAALSPHDELPDDMPDKPSPVETAARRPQIGDSRPAPAPPTPAASTTRPAAERSADSPAPKKRRRRGGRGRGSGTGGGGGGGPRPVQQSVADELPVELDEETLERRRGRERKGRPVGRYMMAVHVRPDLTQIAILEGRSLIEHYVSRPQDAANQIDGNIYLGRVQNVLPGMEAAFIDIGTPKNAVLYRGDVRYDHDDVLPDLGGNGGEGPRIEHLLKAGQTILCQVTKNPIGTKGARLTQEVSLPGRFGVLIPNSKTYGISKRLSDDKRKRLRRILEEVKPEQHGIIVRTAAEGANADELRRDVLRLVKLWDDIDALAQKTKAPALLYREPDLAVRIIREEFNKDYRAVIIDDESMHDDVRDYIATVNPELADRVELFDPVADGLPLFERHHVHEQLHRALDRKVWLPSGGSLIIERTEALTVIDVNTGKNVGTSSLEETVYRNNLEAAEEIARQLRLRD